jgi:cobyrinic acid a,c-diamide synthase
MVTIPRVVIAAPASGAGKTTVATGLMAALRDRGLTVSPHKVGPDYIDPGYHALATGVAGRNLDPVLCGPERIAPLFAHGAGAAARAGGHPVDLAVVEGVMGLHDGTADPDPAAGEEPDHGSTAHVARLLAAPVVLVVDARGMGASVAPLVHGFAGWDRRVRLAGVILNRVGSPRHEAALRAALAGPGPGRPAVPVLGALRRDDTVAVPSRHLGLVPAAERSAAATRAVERLAALVAAGVDLDAVLALARSAPPLPLPGGAWDPAAAIAAAPAAPADPPAPPGAGPGTGAPVRVALAAGAAFTFGYAEHAELLAAAGAEVVPFDPLREPALPAGSDALVIGGGFPEEHAADLAANTALRAEIAAFARAGRPVVGECAGLLYLGRSLDGRPMCDVLGSAAAMTGRLTLGYRRARAATANVLTPAGATVRAHEFHHTRLTGPPAATEWRPAWRVAGRDGAPARSEGFVGRRLHASYLHLHWAGLPGAPARLVAAAHAARPGSGSGGPAGRRS